jgi:hypothetical protein
MSFIPRVSERKKNRVILSMKTSDPDVVKWRIRGHKTLDGCITAPSLIVGEVKNGATYQSNSFQKSGVHVDYHGSGHRLQKEVETKFVLNLNDFKTGAAGTGVLPTDDQTLFLRAEPYRATVGAYDSTGGILIVPPVNRAGGNYPLLAVSGTAPGNNKDFGAYPASADLSLYFPRRSRSVNVMNNHATDGLLFALGEGVPFSLLTVSNSPFYNVGEFQSVHLCSDTGNDIPFTLLIQCHDF